MNVLKVKNIPLDELQEYENNPRRISEEAISAVSKSIEEFGFKVPVIIDKDNVIVAGHTRVRAAKALGLKEVPCVVADDLTPEQIKAFRLADNKTSELSGWDFEKLDIELEELSDFDMSEFGFVLEDEAVNPEEFFRASEPISSHEKTAEVQEITCPECGAKIKIE